MGGGRACAHAHACKATHGARALPPTSQRCPALLVGPPSCEQIKEFGEPAADTASKDQAAAGGAPAAPAAPLTAKDLDLPAVEVIPHALQKLEKPADEIYTVRIPEGMTYLDLDIIKITAQFVARNGKAFLTGLSSREHTNPQFNFLKPTHSLFSFFTSLCDAYSRVLMPPKGTKDKLKKDLEDM